MLMEKNVHPVKSSAKSKEIPPAAELFNKVHPVKPSAKSKGIPPEAELFNRVKQNNLFGFPKLGDVVSGRIIGIKGSAIFIDLGAIGAGIIYGREFYEAKNFLKSLKLGKEIFAKVLDLDNEEGYIELSVKQAERELAWETLRKKKEKNEKITVKILGANKGGLLTKVANISGFLPVSQLSFEYYPRVDEGDKIKIARELQKLVGKELEVKIFDVDQEQEKLILSEKAQKLFELKKGFKNLKPGVIVEGEITGIVDFGAFIRFSPPKDLTGLDKKAGAQEMPTIPILEGLIHISELDWRMIDDPGKVVKIGEKVKAKIIEIADSRISLSLRALKKNPWDHIEKKYKKGDIIKGVVAKFNSFGAFVRLTPEIQGLVHISEFGTEAKMKKALNLGKKYEFQILQIDRENHKIALKMKMSN